MARTKDKVNLSFRMTKGDNEVLNWVSEATGRSKSDIAEDFMHRVCEFTRTSIENFKKSPSTSEADTLRQAMVFMAQSVSNPWSVKSEPLRGLGDAQACSQLIPGQLRVSHSQESKQTD